MHYILNEYVNGWIQHKMYPQELKKNKIVIPQILIQ